MYSALHLPVPPMEIQPFPRVTLTASQWQMASDPHIFRLFNPGLPGCFACAKQPPTCVRRPTTAAQHDLPGVAGGIVDFRSMDQASTNGVVLFLM